MRESTDILPPDPDLQELHQRDYVVRAWKIDDSSMLLRGGVRDQKPPGLYVEGDPDPITIHHMVVELTVSFPALEITAAHVLFETHPHTYCPTITEHYGKLVGLSIARGFTHKVRELFGGPRGCTHTTALLQAMAPVAVQCTWSMRVAHARADGEPGRPAMNAQQRKAAFDSNLNTCHVWDEHGERVAALRNGEVPEPPMQVTRRLIELGRDPREFFAGRDG